MEGPNPYAPPAADLFAPASTANEHEATRRRLIGTETNIRSLGSLAIFGGVLSVPMTLGTLKAAPVVAIVSLVISALTIYTGLALRKLDSVGRILFTALSAIGLGRSAYSSFAVASQPGPSLAPAVLVQAIVVALFLALVWGKNAGEIFTDHYRRVVIPATPHVKYKTSIVAIVVLIVLLVGLAAAILAAVLVG